MPNDQVRIAAAIDRLIAGRDRRALDAFMLTEALRGNGPIAQRAATRRMEASTDHAERRYWLEEACDCLPGAHPN